MKFALYIYIYIYIWVCQYKVILHCKKVRSRRYPAQTIMDADYADDITLLENTPTQVEFQQHNQERAAGGIAYMSMQTKITTCSSRKIKQEISPTEQVAPGN